MTEQSPPARPAPVPDAASQPFFDAAAQGKLLIKHCGACNRYLAPPAEFCDTCLSDAITWREASGRGTVYSFVINHQAGHPGFAALVPYNIIVVELEEGPRLNSNYLGANNEIEVNMPVKVAFERAGEFSVPRWVKV